jgi:capsule polysaccharide export protein KpsE/RkpR
MPYGSACGTIEAEDEPMSDNILQTLQHLVQDVIAPDVRELKVRVNSLEKQMDVRFNALDQKNDAQFKALLAAIAESKAQAELKGMRIVASLSERVAVLEAQRH